MPIGDIYYCIGRLEALVNRRLEDLNSSEIEEELNLVIDRLKAYVTEDKGERL